VGVARSRSAPLQRPEQWLGSRSASQWRVYPHAVAGV
jgi:hypothetical protein